MRLKKLEFYFLELIFLMSSIHFSFGIEEKNDTTKEIVHFMKAAEEFEIDKDQIKYELCKSYIKEYYNSEAYGNEVAVLCKEAEHYFSQLNVTEKSLIFFDVDDTAVRSSCWEVEFLGINIPPIKSILPVLDLYKLLIAKGFNVIFITGRRDQRYEETKQELEESGYHGFVDLICMPHELWINHVRESVGLWKCSVRKELAQHYDIVGSIGDRDLDFVGGYSGKIIKLPNYLY